MITVILVRHGQSVGNLLGMCCGQKDYPLTEQGLEQARMTGEYLKAHYRIDHIYASSLTRTMQTAAPTAEAFGLETIPSDALKEMSGGILEGVSKKEIFENKEYYESFCTWNDTEDFCPEGGETKRQMRERVLAFWGELIQKHKGECIALFSHWGPVFSICQSWNDPNHAEKRICNMEDGTLRIPNSSITVVELDDDGTLLRVKELGYNAHLGSIVSDSIKGLV